ncbi:MAG TPA: hypothetical protein VF303_01340 [Candidatus Nanoarchaeia archaeon]
MSQKTEKIKKKFGMRLVGGEQMQRLVCETISIFPPEIIDYVTKNVWFVSSFEDAWGFVLKIDELKEKGEYLIFLGDELFEQDKYAQRYEIAHEVGHVILKHRNAITQPQSKEEIDRQEAEAHEFTLKYLKS